MNPRCRGERSSWQGLQAACCAEVRRALGAGIALCLGAGSVGGQAAPDELDSDFERTTREVVRPAWWVEGVPDTVWLLVEASAAVLDDVERARGFLQEAEALSRASLDEDPASVNKRYALAVVLGFRADREGGRTKVVVASDLHRELERILEADPEHARARHLLGRLHAAVRRMNPVTRWLATNLLGGGVLKGAKWETAEEHLLFAERRAPEVSDHHLQLANLYRDTDRPELALVEVEHVEGLEVTSPTEQGVRDEATRLRHALETHRRRRRQLRKEGRSPASHCVFEASHRARIIVSVIRVRGKP